MSTEIKFNTYAEMIEIEHLLALAKYRTLDGKIFYKYHTEYQIMGYIKGDSYLVVDIDEINKTYGVTCYGSTNYHTFYYPTDKKSIRCYLLIPTYKGRTIIK
jgi:hypothetical protein